MPVFDENNDLNEITPLLLTNTPDEDNVSITTSKNNIWSVSLNSSNIFQNRIDNKGKFSEYFPNIE